MIMRPNCAGIWRGNEKRDECRVSRDNKGKSVEGRVTSGKQETQKTGKFGIFPRLDSVTLPAILAHFWIVPGSLDIGPRSNRRSWFIRLNTFHTFLTAKVSKKNPKINEMNGKGPWQKVNRRRTTLSFQ